MDEDTDIAELKELVRRNTLLAQDTNKMVHQIRRSGRWGTLFSIIWWALILGASAYSYYVYVQPYVDQIVKVYGSTQNAERQLQNFFGQYFGTTTRP